MTPKVIIGNTRLYTNGGGGNATFDLKDNGGSEGNGLIPADVLAHDLKAAHFFIFDNSAGTAQAWVQGDSNTTASASNWDIPAGARRENKIGWSILGPLVLELEPGASVKVSHAYTV